MEPIKERMIKLEAELMVLSKILQEEKSLQEKIVIEELNVDKIVVEKLEYHNNFGALGIKELKGRLNIGANYGVSMPSPFEEKLQKSRSPDDMMNNGEQQRKQKKQEGPRVTYHKKDL